MQSRWATRHGARLLDDLDGFVRREVEQRAGRVANFTGDGHLLFDHAEDALFTALRISHGVHALVVEVRTGMHTGDVTVRSSVTSGVSRSTSALA